MTRTSRVPSSEAPELPDKTVIAKPAEWLRVWVRRVQEHPWFEWAPLITTIVLLIASAGILIHFVRKLWFFADDWDFFLNRQVSHNTVDNLFRPHNEHWVTLPVLAFRLLYSIFGVRDYLPYGLLAVAVHILACLVLRSVLLRVSVNPWVVTAMVGIFAFLGAGAENLLWDFQISFMGSVLFGLIGLRLALGDEGRRRSIVAGWVALILGLMCSGMGMPMVVLVFFYYWIAVSFRRAVLSASAPLVAYVIWYLGIGHTGSDNDPTTYSQLTHVPDFAVTGLDAIWSNITGVTALGLILLLLMTAAPFFDSVPRRVAPLALAGLAAVVVEYVVVGIGRIRFGIAEASAPRYLYVGAALTIPTLANLTMLADERIRQFRTIGRSVGVLALAVIVVRGVGLEQSYSNGRMAQLALIKPEIQGAALIVKSGERTLYDYPNLTSAPDVNVTALARPGVQEAFGTPTVSAQGMLDAAGVIQVGVANSPLPVADADRFQVVGATPTTDANGCSFVAAPDSGARVDVPGSATGAQISVTTPASSLLVQLVRGKLYSAAQTRPIQPGTVAYVATSAKNADLHVALPSNEPVTICLIRP